MSKSLLNQGLGFVAHDADDWFKAGEDYAHLLSQLAKNYDSQPVTESDLNSKKSLVENSLNSRSRVHYHKFTKGKDLTKYKNEELACILGKGKKEEQVSNSLNMKEYFKIKRQSKVFNGNNEKSENIVVEITDGKDSECDDNNGRKKKKQKHKIICESSNELCLDNQETPSFNKKRKFEQSITSDDTTQVLDEANLEVCKKFKSNKKKNENKTSKIELPINKLDYKNNVEFQDIISSDENQNNSHKNNNIRVDNLDKGSELRFKKKKSKSKFNNEIHIETKGNVESSATNDLEVNGDDDTQSVQNDESVICNNSENHSSKEKTKKLTKLNFTKKYQTLVDSIIENSSAGKKFCKDTPPEFYKKVEHFIEKVKEEPGSTDTFTPVEEVKSSTKEKLYKEGELKNLNPEDKNFINDFESQKSKLLKKKLTLQQTPKSINDKAIFVAKYSDLLFFGSNINEIKGYGEF
ncbi:leucine-rich repeat and coiled-coil domain-containing protein PF3D7_0703800-like isoform X2 [Daktulosphaira vitifoliae]|uniref:leucine-rich repeat and coiled-coil domain-containing protein PF3D7_0703800-like isoform X2 n=1 Tax=Daktulosphaira vitifoliae TaxID=58002 RepID=UPI0021A9B85D|nr:leucine-rich repeat and coiled-coil domain-containing protein PF3D7_0703800-like isoform X2 [Daktulosphaira vitifoliae]